MPTVQNDPMFTHTPVRTEDTTSRNWLWPTIALVAALLVILFVMLTNTPRAADPRVMSQPILTETGAAATR
ncbi:MAG: hypothetical protein QM645_00325 [Asticcacaulis sp.]